MAVLNAKIKAALVKIDFVKRYEELSSNFSKERTPLWQEVKGKINGSTALDIQPHQRYALDKAAAGSTCCLLSVF